MTKMTLISMVATAAAFLAAPDMSSAGGEVPVVEEKAVAPIVKKGSLPVNGIDYYYEIRGEGEPLLLLHGGLGQIEMFAPVMPVFADHRQVIAVDLQGHGRTPLGKRPIDLAAIGADLAILVKQLGYDKLDVFGYSFGGGVALNMAANAPDQVRRLVILSAPYAQDGFFPEMLPQQAAVGAGMAEMMKDSPMFLSYKAVAPDVSEFPKLLDAMGALMREPKDYSDAVAKLTMPVMLIYGDADMIRPEHMIDFYHKLGGGLRDAGWMRENMSKNRLAILPDLTHYETFASPLMANVAMTFLDGGGKAPNWAEQVGR
ncbi:alpha/beta fold hydrolase [Rhizobium sp. NZLR1]|nr:alpha/beta fold hydrolase [Rhizobium sp. NZLR8]MBX5163363.1 alpha/beta fold hydrolase [Rhizobium sp. NZLR4b]MBX5171210.1 alpha/beta fold hydrolase [Rhizobium sp. NZLR1b]MBX5186910.1 alpha/beta fold hydrolase [Rhizobium sp. NZLR5]MBX5188597.1 alpha/beta fold hydrolase [Rhizobium sp. NZLR3b]MBX5195805.1 alpha/beta fold hydrolase [Rhizobium sp. NZLR10]MBX5205720.1 alpha/beta fold hydrolase [Rhizobium sp. NZLR1]MBX5207782.1 alpha/beta fold hydrolase [Rhizobium sp. NZLR11]